MELTVDCTRDVRGCLQRILADLPGMSMPSGKSSAPPAAVASAAAALPEPGASPPPAPAVTRARPRELGGRAGPEPTRFGDWEKNGRCIDF
jgi:hypothetical protein